MLKFHATSLDFCFSGSGKWFSESQSSIHAEKCFLNRKKYISFFFPFMQKSPHHTTKKVACVKNQILFCELLITQTFPGSSG